MEVNEALFQLNGRCGYVLKPDRLAVNPTRLNIRIISGQQLQRSTESSLFSPAVDVEILGFEGDCNKLRTKSVKSHGNYQIWNEEFIFDLIHPQCDFLRLQVIDSDLLATSYTQCTLLINSLEQGYRHIPLFLNDANLPFSTLFVFIAILEITE